LALIVGVLIQGLKRAAFSNEAGVGSAAIAHAAVKTNEPLTEGYVALLEPFIDTVVICTMTALVMVITGACGTEGLTGVAVTSSAFQSVFPWFGVVLAIAMSIFNVIGLYMLMGSLREDLKDYQSRVASGEIKRYK
jgi:AGCS family alanine or glycine:cation symporter